MRKCRSVRAVTLASPDHRAGAMQKTFSKSIALVLAVLCAALCHAQGTVGGEPSSGATTPAQGQRAGTPPVAQPSTQAPSQPGTTGSNAGPQDPQQVQAAKATVAAQAATAGLAGLRGRKIAGVSFVGVEFATALSVRPGGRMAGMSPFLDS